MKKRLNKRSPRPRGEQLVSRTLEQWDVITGEEILESIDSMPHLKVNLSHGLPTPPAPASLNAGNE
ncbi:hypothetical protein BDZ91DRAFT_796344 [Kalaharituber pfeilii]|nr:hypothetical protein BDZ91DRAFT_796344 [Kalaharituber pfeilii]